MRIDTALGFIDAGGVALGPRTTHDAFRETSAGATSTPLVLNGLWRSYSVRVESEGTPFYVAAYFHEQRLEMVEIVNVSDEFGTSWSDWSPENEQRRREWHNRWLQRLGVHQGEYSWGTLTSMTDPKSGGSSIVIRYKNPK